MNHINVFRENTDLIKKYGEGNAHLIWSMGLYLDESDLDRLAIDGLTDGGGDKKIDFLIQANSTLYIVQGYYSEKVDFKIAAPSNKASDLNTAMAWLASGNEDKVPVKLRDKIKEVRILIEYGDIDSIEILYVHNCAESENVRVELETCANWLSRVYSQSDISISYKELGCKNIETLYIALSQQIVVKDKIPFSGQLVEKIKGDGWDAHIGIVNGDWLYEMHQKYDSDLFSANYRGFMGLGKRKKINTAIRQTAESSAKDFFVYNNGVSILTIDLDEQNKVLHGLSIINGAQTTGSISSVANKENLKNVRVMCRIIVCNNADKVKKIVEYNNTQNHITTWDHYTNSPEQKLLVEEFNKLGYVYSLKRGFDNSGSMFGIEEVAQSLVALHGDYLSANRGKNYVFETKSAYDNAFHDSKAQHILLAYCISKSIEKVKSDLKNKTPLTDGERDQLSFLQNLKSKHFLIAIIGRVMDELIKQPIDLKLVKFKYSTALKSNNSIEDLINIFRPVIGAILPTVIKNTGHDLYTYLKNENPLDTVASEVKQILSALRSLQSIPALDNLVEYVE